MTTVDLCPCCALDLAGHLDPPHQGEVVECPWCLTRVVAKWEGLDGEVLTFTADTECDYVI